MASPTTSPTCRTSSPPARQVRNSLPLERARSSRPAAWSRAWSRLTSQTAGSVSFEKNKIDSGVSYSLTAPSTGMSRTCSGARRHSELAALGKRPARNLVRPGGRRRACTRTTSRGGCSERRPRGSEPGPALRGPVSVRRPSSPAPRSPAPWPRAWPSPRAFTRGLDEFRGTSAPRARASAAYAASRHGRLRGKLHVRCVQLPCLLSQALELTSIGFSKRTCGSSL
ncbi:hypothetical protein F4802DRAFT_127267 [Xylaria palmicola]|nr:hypothetical protein F4802DRAFT_127267 [Xylaria palmicola]